ncbi:DUF4810 domain-containing protein [Treponema pectinovorum]|uniref:DUF4810 domain-containing protein n=1 Tax=Treponema pectinovorum TaxID=164 RepID=UPI001658F034|nr:DUF4810 domain-containing protein [Treponema pectinovorum]
MKKKLEKMAFAFLLGTALVLFASCGTTKLYSWYDYQEDYYHFVKNNDKKSFETLIKTYDKLIKKQNETRGVVPPGIYADYGFVLIQSGKTTEGKAMLAKEIELYPESEVFVGAILKRAK